MIDKLKISTAFATIEEDPTFANGQNPHEDEKNECLILSLGGDYQY